MTGLPAPAVTPQIVSFPTALWLLQPGSQEVTPLPKNSPTASHMYQWIKAKGFTTVYKAPHKILFLAATLHSRLTVLAPSALPKGLPCQSWESQLWYYLRVFKLPVHPLEYFLSRYLWGCFPHFHSNVTVTVSDHQYKTVYLASTLSQHC